MITFDKIKFVAPIYNIDTIQEDKFDNIYKNGTLAELKYTQQSPYLLYIEVDYIEQELVIEFTGKILLEHYPMLISRATIKECLNNINTIGICQLNVEAILQDGEVCKADVCRDIEYHDCMQLTQSINLSVKNHNKYLARTINNNFIIEKNVKSKTLKKRLTIYDKGKEIRLVDNRDFLCRLNAPQVCIDYFTNKIRFELNLNSKEQIRKSLHISETGIQSVLNSESNPILDYINVVLAEEDMIPSNLTVNNYCKLLLLQNSDYDLAKVETVVRQLSSNGTHISQAMQPFRKLMKYANMPRVNGIKKQLQKLLLEITILIMFVSI